jgi:hypothetical protein
MPFRSVVGGQELTMWWEKETIKKPPYSEILQLWNHKCVLIDE